jgi:hypothetical protein
MILFFDLFCATCKIFSNCLDEKLMYRESGERINIYLFFSLILCNTLSQIQYWKQQKPLTQKSCGSKIHEKAACVPCTASYRWQCRYLPGLWRSEEAFGGLSCLRWYVSDHLFLHQDIYFLLQVASDLWNFHSLMLIENLLGVLICALSLLFIISILCWANDIMLIFLTVRMVKHTERHSLWDGI